MGEFDSINWGSENWLEAIPSPAADTVAKLLETGWNNEEVAKIWLSTTGADANAGFGGSGRLGNYFSNFISELNAFLCGDKRYEQDIKKATHIWETQGKVHLVSAISSVVALKIGLAPAALVPCVALILSSVGKVGINSYCKTIKQKMS